MLQLPAKWAWPDPQTPERTALWAGDSALSRWDALKAALQGERRGHEFDYAVAGINDDPGIGKPAKEFVWEEAEHVETLKRWIAMEESAQRARSIRASES